MATTTAAAQRDLMITTVKAIVPASLAQKRWDAYDEKTLDFRSWADEQKIAAFRCFAIHDLGSVTNSVPIDTVQAWHDTTFEFVAAYPVDFRYGANLLSLETLAWQDLNRIDDAIGTRGFATFGDASVETVDKTFERREPCCFAVLRLRVQFWRATP